MTCCSLLLSSLVVSAFFGLQVSGLAVSPRSEDGGTPDILTRNLGAGASQSRTGEYLQWMEDSSGARLPGAVALLQGWQHTGILTEQVDTIDARTVFRREESPAESKSPILRNLPWVVMACAILVVFIVAAVVILFQGRKKYQRLDEPAPEGVQDGRPKSENLTTRLISMKVLRMSQGSMTPSQGSLDASSQISLDNPEYKDALRRKAEAGDLMPSRRPQKSVANASLLQNAVPPAFATSPASTELLKLPPPAAPAAPSTSFESLPNYDLAAAPQPSSSSTRFSPPPAPSAIAPPTQAMSKTMESHPKIVVPEDNSLPNPYAIRDSQMGSPILTSPVDDQSLPNPYAHSMVGVDGHSPVRADSPEPFGDINQAPPLRVENRKSTGPGAVGARSSTFDMNRLSRNSTLYTLPLLDISSTSLALSMSSQKFGSSSQGAPGTDRS